MGATGPTAALASIWPSTPSEKIDSLYSYVQDSMSVVVDSAYIRRPRAIFI